jgi:hypothetical protein
MTTRYLTTDQNGNGDQTYWDINGYFLHGPSGEKLNLGGGNTTVTASNEIVQIGTSYIRIPQGVSNERPTIPDSYIGMMRYLTTENLLEYFNGQTNTWIPISLPSPTISSISPNYISFNQSGPETNTNTYTLTGSNFNIAPGGISVEVIGNNGAGTILLPDSNSASSETSATFTFDPSGTEQLIGISNELPFAVKLTNTNSGFSSTLNNAIIATNAGPEFTQPSVFTPSSFQTFAVQDPCANFIVSGIDLSQPKHYPLDFSFVSGTAGGFNVGGGDISKNGPLTDSSSSTVKVPAGNRLSATASSYNFTMRVTDASNAFSDANYTLSLANPVFSSLTPSVIQQNTLTDISLVGQYFIIDSSLSVFLNSNPSLQGTVSDTLYVDINNLTFKINASNVGFYDISINNGIVSTGSSNVLYVGLVTATISNTNSTVDISYIDTDGETYISSPVVNGFTLYQFKTTSNTTTGTATISLSQSVSGDLLIVGGGAGTGNSSGGGGGGEVIQRNDYNLNATTTYNITVGKGGGANITGTTVGSSEGGDGANSIFDVITANSGKAAAPYGGPWPWGGTSGSGLKGGSGQNASAGGGGGAREPGEGAHLSVVFGNRNGGAGGSGESSSITGSLQFYGGGGGGPANPDLGGAGGQGGGGNGGQGPSGATVLATAGTPHTGGGGGGGANNPGTEGGSGIVVLKIPSCVILAPSMNDITIGPSLTYYKRYLNSSNDPIAGPVSGGKTVYFITSGSDNITPNFTGNIDYLAIAGGGGGGGLRGGGGGSGELLISFTSVTNATPYTLTVGPGGTGVSSANGTKGGNTTLFSKTLNGGGYGGGTASASGGSGGSGGGGGGYAGGGGSIANGGSSSKTASGQGNNGGGGGSFPSTDGGGGGGGSSTTGGTCINGSPGSGGSAITSTFTGTSDSKTYGGGGGGGDYEGGIGGLPGACGGNGAPRNFASGLGGNGGVGSGGGGGNGKGGDGGTGIIILKFDTF